MKTLLVTLLLLAAPGLKFDKTVHDFGTVFTTDGPQSCEFTVSNTSDEAVSILAVVSSCGCTDVQWPRESIPPGGTGKISVTYSNDDGPYPFDKVLTVYISSEKKPVILHVKGVVKKK